MTHRPQRFEVYTELPDGSGFTLKDCTHVFKYDSHGGWFDEQSNYYNCKGEPTSAPEESVSDHDKESNHGEDDFFEDIAKQYDYDDRHDEDYAEDEYSDEQIINLENIDLNKQLLSHYPQNKPLRVFYENIERNLTEDKITQLYNDIGVLAVVPEISNGKREGKGHFVVSGKDKARKLIELQGKKKIQRLIYYKVESLTELLADPIPLQHLKQNSTNNTQTKPQITKSQEPPIQSPQKKTEILKDKPIESKIVEASKTEPAKEFESYQFPLLTFKSSDDFKNWMSKLGLHFNTDYKALKKITNPDKSVFGTLQMRKSAFNIANKQKFGDNVIQFKPYN